ncbi:hypothetical protein EAY46_29240, partial [Vibrio anguillarum]|nr:hypothetical protein [Vibrio anguillarum]
VTNTDRVAPDFPDRFGSAALTIYFDKFGWYAPDKISIQPQFIKGGELRNNKENIIEAGFPRFLFYYAEYIFFIIRVIIYFFLLVG